MRPFALLLCFILFASCVENPVVSPSKEDILSSWKGTFSSTYHTDGVILYWHLLKNGTMTGKWETDKGSSVFNVEGTYQIIGAHIRFHGEGTLVLYDQKKTQTRISGNGTLDSNTGTGAFKIQIDNPNYRDDTGFWDVVKI